MTCVLTVRRREAVMKVLKQLQNLQLPVKLKGSQCQGVMVTVGNGCSHVAGSSQLCPDSPASATPQNQNKSATGSEPAHSNQHVLNTRRQLTYNHPWHYSGGEMHCEWFKSTPAGTCACFYLLRQLWLGFPLKILPFPQFESRPIVSGNPAQHT